MGYLNERVAFLKGLAEGLDIKDESKEGRILTGIIEVLSEMADAISELEASHQELDEYVENLDEDLSDLEDVLFGDDDDDDDDDDEDEDEDEPDPLSDDGYIEVECAHCHEKVYLDQQDVEDRLEIFCPSCGHALIDKEENPAE